MTKKLDSLIIPSKPIINQKSKTIHLIKSKKKVGRGNRDISQADDASQNPNSPRNSNSRGGKTNRVVGMKGTNMGGADELVELGRRRLVAPPLLGVVVAEAPEPPQRRLHLLPPAI
jgi:hypothetical protein